MKRNAIALLVTISFVTVIVALIGISTGMVNDSFKRISNKLFLIQSNVIFTDFIYILEDATADVNDSMALDIFLSVPLFFENKQNDISVDISFESDASTININHLLKEDDNKSKKRTRSEHIPLRTVYEEYFERILSIYNVADKVLFLSMIADTLDKDLKERSIGSEIAIEDPFFTQGHIYDMNHFQQIVSEYKKQTKDLNIDAVPWEKLIGFNAKSVDFNHINSEALQYLAPEIDPESLGLYTTDRVDIYSSIKNLPFDDETKKRMEEIDVDFYNPLVSAEMNINSGNNNMQITFLYDLSTKKVSNIEISN